MPPQAEQAPGTSLAPKTQLRHEGKERPVWRVALAPNTDAGASEWQGREGSADQKATETPPHLAPAGYPQAPGQWQLPSQVGKGFAPQAVLSPSGPFSTRRPPICFLPIK